MHFKEIIQSAYPALKINKFDKMGEGDTYIAFLVNGQYLFKLPKEIDGSTILKKEVQLMESLAEIFSISIPKFVFVSPVFQFGAYEILPGITLAAYLKKNELSSFQVEQINDFLEKLHSYHLPEHLSDILPLMNYFEEYNEDYEFLKNSTTAFFSKTQKRIILDKYVLYLSDKSNFEYKPALLHNDFSFNHILCNRGTGKITGVIDFGDAAIGDAAFDYIYLYELQPYDFFKKIWSPCKEGKDQLIKRIHFYSFANTVQMLIGYIRENNFQMIKMGRNNINKWFKVHEKSVDY
ncbi:MAG: aminoglycoside phosphotransferase family protein [Bacteroidetes bacterium]|nr:aminoglycoside phosphotransferase family protein [Bacteroidota bacterium]